MFDVRERPEFVERALLVGVYSAPEEEGEAEELLDELGELVRALGVAVVGRTLVHIRAPRARLLIGSGRAEEIVLQAEASDADCIVFDHALTPAQQRNWEAISRVCVVDRQEVILDIFGRRARTREAKLQVELARMEYSMPRLKRAWTHLGRQGGSGGTGDRGEGEAQIELDRRMVRRRISTVRRELAVVRKHRATQRKERRREPVPLAAIVGYTNAGKSSLLRRLTGADVMVADMLFATLDTTTRRISLPNGRDLLLTDTVGFVRRLPHDLIEAFKATLEEAVLARFLVHVLDASHPNVDAFMDTTSEVLSELGAGATPMLHVFNKIDLADSQALALLRREYPNALYLSVKTGEGCDALRDALADMLADDVTVLELRIPHARADLVAALHEQGAVLQCEYRDDAVYVEATLARHLAPAYEPYRTDASRGCALAPGA